MRVSAVILTMGDRPSELEAAIGSLRSQEGCDIEIVVVGNGASPDVEAHAIVVLEENVGIPEGRNRGVDVATGDLIFFLDDDAVLEGERACRTIIEMFESDNRLFAVSLRIIDPVTGLTQRRHVPRLGHSDPKIGSEVTTFLGGASIVRTEVFHELGGFPSSFFYAHEETDLAWRALDAGWRIEYAPQVVVTHPATKPSRHPASDRLSMRNRVWLARRNLPFPLLFIYPVVWLAISLFRNRSMSGGRSIVDGFLGGWRGPVERRPMRWQSVARMAQLGRPPII